MPRPTVLRSAAQIRLTHKYPFDKIVYPKFLLLLFNKTEHHRSYTLHHEIALVANLPALNDGQRLLEAIERPNTSINNLTTTVNTLRADVTTLKADVTILRVDVTNLKADMNNKFDSLELGRRADSLNQTARVYNSHISTRDIPLRALHDRQNMAVEGFPRDSASLMRLPGNALTTLLDAFQLPADGTVEVKTRRLREFVGLVKDS